MAAGMTGRQRRRYRRRGMFVRVAGWLGDKLQHWAESGARRIERAGERARDFTEEGGERAQRVTDRGERRAAHWSERTGRGIRRTGEELEDLGRRQPYGYETGTPYAYESGMAGPFPRSIREPSRSPHVGRGPKGYRRSDDRIREEACEELTFAELDASDIDVSVKNGEVTLRGTVERREWKRLAEDLIAVISGVQEVQNQLRVSARETETQSPKRSESSFPTLGEQTPH